MKICGDMDTRMKSSLNGDCLDMIKVIDRGVWTKKILNNKAINTDRIVENTSSYSM